VSTLRSYGDMGVIMPPDALQPGSPDERSDIWYPRSIACIITGHSETRQVGQSPAELPLTVLVPLM
jgi:hypothetical protein